MDAPKQNQKTLFFSDENQFRQHEEKISKNNEFSQYNIDEERLEKINVIV